MKRTLHALLVASACLTIKSHAQSTDGAAQPFDPTKASARLTVNAAGIVRVTREDLAPADTEIAGKDPRRFNLYYKGEIVPLYFADEADGVFDAGECFYFHGTYLQGTTTTKGLYSDASSYYLVADDSAKAARYLELRQPAGLAAPALDAPGALIGTMHWEDNYIYPPIENHGGEDTDFLFFGTASSMQKPFAPHFLLQNLDENGGTCKVEVKLFGRSNLPVNPDHLVRISLNGEEVGTLKWEGAAPALFSRDGLSPKMLHSQDNTIGINPTGEMEEARRVSPGEKDAQGLAAKALDVVHVDWIRIEYPVKPMAFRALGWVATRDEFDARISPSQFSDEARTLKIAGFPSSDVVVLDVGNHEAPQTATDTNSDGTASVSFPVRPNAETHVIAATSKEVRRPLRVEIPIREHIVDAAAGKQLVIVAHDGLIGEARRLAAHKEATGLPAIAVATSAVYDQFGQGHKSPDAIRDFLRTVHKQDGKLKYALLMGSADRETWEPEAGKARKDLIPVHWYSSVVFPPFPNDTWYGQLDDASRDIGLAIGRFPVRDEATAKACVDKVIAFESGTDSDWKRSGLFLASQESMFQTELDQSIKSVSQQCARFTPERVYAKGSEEKNPDGSRIDYRIPLLKSLNSGTGLVYFAGHGGGNVWQVGPNWPPTAETNMLDLNDIASLKNKGRTPIVMAATCYSAMFVLKNDERSLGVDLVNLPDAGAVCVISSSYRCYFNEAAMIFNAMLTSIYRDRVPTLGDAYVASLKTTSSGDTRESMTLLGDPSLRVSQLWDCGEAVPSPTSGSAPQEAGN